MSEQMKMPNATEMKEAWVRYRAGEVDKYEAHEEFFRFSQAVYKRGFEAGATPDADDDDDDDDEEVRPQGGLAEVAHEFVREAIARATAARKHDPRCLSLTDGEFNDVCDCKTWRLIDEADAR